MDRKKFLAERQWIRNQLSNVADFWLKNGWARNTAALPPAWTGLLRFTPLIRVCGYRAATAGHTLTCAISMVFGRTA